MPIEPPPPGTSLLLDNDVFTDWRYRKPNIVAEINNYQSRFKMLPALTSFTVFEALSGFENAEAKGSPSNERMRFARDAAEQLIAGCLVLPFDQESATVAAYIFWRLSRSDRNKHWKDVFVAATALAHRYGIATRNFRDFQRIASSLPASHPRLYITVWKQ